MKFTLKLTLLFLSASTALYAQNDRQYLDKNFEPVSDSTQAEYYREIEKDAEGWIVKDFYKSGQVQMIARSHNVDPSVVKEGPATFFFPNGNKQRYGNYHDDRPVGLFRAFYENGQPQNEVFFATDKAYYWQHWDSQGKPMLVNGNGFVSIRQDGTTTNQEVKDSVVAICYTIKDGATDTVYLMIEKLPEYPGGYTEMMADIRANMTYPRSARRLGIDGTVYVSMVIDKKGNVTNPYVIEGIQVQCDEVALQAVRKLKRWAPGTVHDRPVAVRVTLPIRFKLN